jgi:hypothetical protein
MAYAVEQTDTFGGEANYCWVRRYTIAGGDNVSRRALVRRAKALCGLTGVRCDVSDYGDTIDIRPRGMAQVVFVNWQDDATEG